MKTVFFLLLFISIQPLWAGTGKIGNGDWPHFAYQILLKAQRELIEQINLLSEKEFAELIQKEASTQTQLDPHQGFVVKDKGAVTKSWILSMVQGLRGPSSFEALERDPYNGVHLFYYGYDRKRDEFFIEVKKPFFIRYGLSNLDQLDQAILFEVKRKILHELAHLWGFDELQSLKFSTEVLSLISVKKAYTSSGKTSDQSDCRLNNQNPAHTAIAGLLRLSKEHHATYFEYWNSVKIRDLDYYTRDSHDPRKLASRLDYLFRHPNICRASYHQKDGRGKNLHRLIEVFRIGASHGYNVCWLANRIDEIYKFYGED